MCFWIRFFCGKNFEPIERNVSPLYTLNAGNRLTSRATESNDFVLVKVVCERVSINGIRFCLNEWHLNECIATCWCLNFIFLFFFLLNVCHFLRFIYELPIYLLFNVLRNISFVHHFHLLKNKIYEKQYQFYLNHTQ